MEYTKTILNIELGSAEFTIAFKPTGFLDKLMADIAMSGNIWERDTSVAIAKLLQPGDCFVDVGAHVGWFTLLAASLVGPTGHVIAFEPFEENFRQLGKNVIRNGFQDRVLCIQAAVSDDDGVREFWVNADNSGGHAFYDVSKHPLAFKTRENPQKITVPTVRLDDVLWKFRHAHPDTPVRVIKIDVEGAEVLVFNGASEWLKSNRTPFVFAEVNRCGLEALGFINDDMVTTMRNFGYGTYLLDDAEFLVQQDSVYNALFSTFELHGEGEDDAGGDPEGREGEQAFCQDAQRSEGQEHDACQG